MVTALITYQPSQNLTLSTALLGLEGQLERAALANVQQADHGFTDAERHSAMVCEKLKLVNGLDLAAVLLRGKLIKEIEDNGLYSIHPAHYQRMEDCARDQGISLSEYTNTRDLCFVIFPFIEESMGLQVAAMWEAIGKSNFRELVPVLKAIITGQEPASASTRGAVNNILNDVAATARAAGEALDDAQLRRQAVDNLLTNAGQMTNRDLRATLRPDPTPPINAVVVGRNGRRYVVAEVDEDQITVLRRKVGASMDMAELALPDNPRARQGETYRDPILRGLIELTQ